MNEKEYLLIMLAEECSEVIQAVSKVLRFGGDDKYGEQTCNERLNEEINHVYAAIEQVHNAKCFDLNRRIIKKKHIAIRKWMNYSRKKGLLK